MVGTFKTIHLTPKPQVQIDGSNRCQKCKSLQSKQVLLSNLANLAQIWPNLVQLTQFVAGVGSSNLIYALTVVITFRNVL